MLKEEGGDPAILARRELLDLLEVDDVLAFRQLKFGAERARVGDLVDIDLGRSSHRAERLAVISHVVPWTGVIQRSDLVDACAGDHEAPVVEVMLSGLIKAHRGAGLGARSALWLLRRRRVLGGLGRAAKQRGNKDSSTDGQREARRESQTPWDPTDLARRGSRGVFSRT
ncbi:MAG: hypothetical protein F4173_03000 [Acidobacteriia bacterium]|nr:hypothetical protein [Terriglobia bacterium]